MQTLIVAKLKFYKAKLLENIVSQPTPNAENGILRNATWRSPEIPLINCKVELEFKWAKYYVLYAAGNESNFNEDAYADNVIFTMKNTQLYVPVGTLSARDNQKLSKLLSKGFERSVYWNGYKTKSDNKNTANEFRCFLESHFVVVNRLFVLVYTNESNNAKRFNAQKNYFPNNIIINYNMIVDEKNFYDQAIDSRIKRNEESRKLTTEKGEDYITTFLLNYDYIKDHYILIAVDSSRQKEVDADPKVIQQTEFVGQLKKLADDDNATAAGNDQSMFILTILEKIKETRLKFSQGSVTEL